MPDARYTLRVAVKTLGEEPVAELETDTSFQVGPVCISIKQQGRYLILSAHDFASDREAEEFLPRLKVGLWNLALQHNIAFIPDFVRREISYSSDNPAKTGQDIAETSGMPDGGPVHGRTEEGGYSIFRSEETIQFRRVGEANGRVSTQVNEVVQALSKGIEGAQPSTGFDDDKFVTAFDLYLGHFYESSIRARFLTLVMVLEVLAPLTDKHAVARALLLELAQKIDAQLPTTSDEDARDSLKALKQQLHFRQKDSIGRRIRHLILNQAAIDQVERETLVEEVVWAYNLRSSLTHEGSVNSDDLYKAHDIALRAVKLILHARIGLIGPSRPAY